MSDIKIRPQQAETDPLLGTSKKVRVEESEFSSSNSHKPLRYTDSLHHYVDQHPEVRTSARLIASIILKDGNYAEVIAPHYLGFTIVEKVSYYAALLIVLLSLIEHPAWCEDNCLELLSLQGEAAFADPNESGDETVYYYPNFGWAILNPFQSCVIETLCCVAFLLEVIWTFNLEQDDNKERKAVLYSKTTCVCLLIIELIRGYCGLVRHMAVYLRIIIFVTFSRDIRRELHKVVKLIPEFLYIFLLLSLVIVFYSWIGVVTFYSTPQGDVYFPNLIEAMWTLWICATTANYPDVMMIGYNSNRLSGIFFVSYMIIIYFILFNLILASVVNIYTYIKSDDEEKRKKVIHDTLRQAFETLDVESKGYLSRDVVMGLFHVLNEEFLDIPRVTSDVAEILYALLDRDGSDTIDLEEFTNFQLVMLIKFESADLYSTFVERNLPNIFLSAWYQKLTEIVKSQNFDSAVDAILVLNAVVITIQTYPMLAGETVYTDPRLSNGRIDTVWEYYETMFTVVYCIEMITKIMVLGWRSYSSSLRHCFDGSITLMSLLATVYVYYPNLFSDSRLIRYIVMARVLRLSRLLFTFKPLHHIMRTCIDILPMARRILLVLLCFMYTFSAVGMHCFGGKITRDPNNELSYILDGTDFSNNSYWANNFNDMMSGMNVLFNLLVVNNWPEQADGILAVTGSKLSRLFFFLFHLGGVMLVNNIVIAIIIDEFMSEYGKVKDTERMKYINEFEVDTVAKRALFNAEEVTGTKTQVTGDYVASFPTRSLSMRRSSLAKLFLT